MIIHRNLSKMNKQNYLNLLIDSLGELGNTLYGVFGAERVSTPT